MKSKHIKGIYRLGHNNKKAVVCESGYKIIPICQCLIGMKDENEETAEENAAYIVKACNAHEELVKALADILLWTKVKNGHAQWNSSEEKIKELKAILQKANGNEKE